VSLEIVGWVATAVFVGSYFCARPATLRRVQMAGAIIWIGYGFAIRAMPVIVANVLVFGAAAASLIRAHRVPPTSTS
jgi:hypothetical protein